MARSTSDPRLTFKSLYHDELSGLTREFQLRFFFEDRSVELTDMGTKKLFLKRTEVRTLSPGDFVLGKKVVVFGRLLHLTEYMDAVTRQLCEGDARGSSNNNTNTNNSADAEEKKSAVNGVRQAAPPAVVACDNCFVFVEAGRHFSTLGRVLSVLSVELGLTITSITTGTIPTKAIDAAVEGISGVGSNNNIAADEGALAGGGGVEAAAQAASAAMIIEEGLRPMAGALVCCIRAAKAQCQNIIPEIYQRLVPSYSKRGGGVGTSGLPSAAACGLFAVACSSSSGVSSSAAAATLPSSLPSSSSSGSSFASLSQRLGSIFDAIATRAATKIVRGAGRVGTVVLIKPHVLASRAAGDVLQVLIKESGASIAAMTLVNLTSREAGELMAGYRGVLPDLPATVAQLSAGAALAVHLVSPPTAAAFAAEDIYRDAASSVTDMSAAKKNTNGNSKNMAAAAAVMADADADADVFTAVRALAGPYDPAIARVLRSASLRSRYGTDRACNAVHCCDIPDDVNGAARLLFAAVAMKKLVKPSAECS